MRERGVRVSSGPYDVLVSATDQASPAPAAERSERLAEALAARVPEDRLEAVVRFARAYTRRLSAEEAEQIPIEDLAAEVAGAFELADGRGSEAFAVRVFAPTLERDGYERAGSVIETNAIDGPFLFDSVTAELEARELSVRRVIHPVVGTVRSADGRIERVLNVREAELRESVMHFELDRRLDPRHMSVLEERIREILGDVEVVVRDFAPMRERVGRMIEVARAGFTLYDEDEIEETVAFLEWLLDQNFVFLGYREYDLLDLPEGRALAVVPESGLGILSKTTWSAYERPVLLETIEPNLRGRIEGGDQLIYSKTNRPSTVHRRARMDYTGVRRVDPSGRIVGELRLVGLFTSKAYAEPAARTPLLQRKLSRIIEAEELYPGSHDYKAVVSLFESFPKDELFAATWEELRPQLMGLLELQERPRVRMFLRRDLYGRSASVLVALPRDRFSPELEHRLAKLFQKRFGATSVDAATTIGEDGLARLHVTVHAGEVGVREVDELELEDEVVELARTWDDRLDVRLQEVHGRDAGHTLFERWAPRFPDYYRSATPIDLAVRDVERLEELERGDVSFVVGVSNEVQEGETLTHVRLYKVGGKIQLSDLVPILEALGLRVVEERPTHLSHEDGERFLHDFGVLDAAGRPLDVDAVGERVAACISAVWRGECESDSLNRLVVTAGLDWRQVEILRAYRKYHHRVNAGFPVEYKNDAFAAHPEIAAGLVRLFEMRFDPDATRDPEAIERHERSILEELEAVSSLEQDRILRTALGVVDATVRTNAYRPERASLAFKFRSAEVPEMPKPTPLFEIFVYTPEMEAIHLRGGRVARGGIRWSDRRQDYRTEVLGLMKAQMVKNAVIVPTGSKGGFVLKRTPRDPEALRQEVVRQYVTFMRGLLDLTDDLDDGKVAHPERVVIHDEDDPYLVVAADKGTATFSDVANGIAAEYGYWLGDAFASGGSTGYDHKALGITARGAWESAKRHFRELGVDPEATPLTVVGIGDMSGDVFGNGMLLSDQIQLVGAFDHRHVFVDPNPNPAAAFAERRRLFELPGSSWDDYDRSAISEGGGVWPRTAKHVPISPQARLALAIQADQLTPDELIRAILLAPVDLLWNGGIGTFVKASTESNADADDRANDSLRVDGRDLRCRVVVEGGNLGFTQRGRTEYALAGGRINTDFIDNSAGVDCSDHEVNLKILLGLAIRRGALDLEARNRLLHEVEADVVRHVLYDNFLQAQILSQEVAASAGRVEAYAHLMDALEADGELDRDLEALPGSEEMADRRRAGRGMARSELAVLLARTKLDLKDALLRSSLPDSRYLEQDLRGYFPPEVVRRFGDLLPEHPLRRELIATLVANDVVNSQGITFVSRLSAETGAEAADVVRAYRIARDVTGAVERWDEVEALVGKIEPDTLDELLGGIDRMVELASRWYLEHARGQLGRAIAAHREPFRSFAEAVPGAVTEVRRQRAERVRWALVDRGVPEEVAARHAYQPALVHGPNVIEVFHAADRPVPEVARAFFAVGDAAFVDRLEDRLAELAPASRWERWAQQGLHDELLEVRRSLAELVLAEADGGDPAEAVGGVLERRADVLGRIGRFLRGLAAEEGDTLAALSVAVRQLRALLTEDR